MANASRQERRIAAQMAAARAEEYAAVQAQAAEALADATSSAAAIKGLRAELRRIERWDFFPPPERDAARAAVQELAARLAAPAREPT